MVGEGAKRRVEACVGLCIVECLLLRSMLLSASCFCVRRYWRYVVG